jgi:hypothetical protein
MRLCWVQGLGRCCWGDSAAKKEKKKKGKKDRKETRVKQGFSWLNDLYLSISEVLSPFLQPNPRPKLAASETAKLP